MRILALCYPTSNGKLHTCGANQNYVLLATHDILRDLSRGGVCVEVVSLYQPVNLTLPSGMKISSISEATLEADVYLHMFRDPSEPEVLDLLQAWSLPPKLTLNDAFKLRDHSKWKYIPLLHQYGIGAEMATPPQTVQWEIQTFSTRISSDHQWVETAAFNNNRGQYSDRRGRERIVTKFIDNATNGIRSFFRIGYVLGRFTTGWLYMAPAEQCVIKSGTAAHSVPFDLPSRHHRALRIVFHELGVDYCHFEGCFVGDKLYVFDINAHPTSSGSTLSFITRDLVALMIEQLEGVLNKQNQ
ncbi:MAG: hypothetical protein NTV80_00385 [Verrucomicrobia bacterium]|nr:hypothetical protein [Verrucomicrobiota bacterium]